MRLRFSFKLLPLIIAFVLVVSCGKATTTSNISSTNSSSNTSTETTQTKTSTSQDGRPTDTTTLPNFTTTTSTTTQTTTTATTANPPTTQDSTEVDIPAGSIALFATLSGGPKSDSLKLPGLHVSWDSTHYQFLRYIPEIPWIDEFDWTTSQSYAHSYIYGFTSGDWVYVVNRSSDTNRNTVTRYDPNTGMAKGQFPDIYVTGDWKFSFTVFSDRLIYRTKIVENLAGQRIGGGDVMSVEIGGKPVKLLDYTDPNNKGSYHAIGSELITIVKTFDMSKPSHPQNGYDIYRVDPATYILGEKLFSYAAKQYVEFFEGETALYWSEKQSETGDIKVIRFPLSEQPYYFLTVSENSPGLISIDESQGKVLVISVDSSPESPFYNLVDLENGTIMELDVDPAFLSSYTKGNGQFYVLD